MKQRVVRRFAKCGREQEKCRSRVSRFVKLLTDADASVPVIYGTLHASFATFVIGE